MNTKSSDITKITLLPSIYVGTYAKYNQGSIEGAWLDLTDYSNPSEFYTACENLHKNEDDPEFMFQDFEGFPSEMYSESGGIDEIYTYLDFIESSHLEADVIQAGLALDIPLESIEDAYNGSHNSDEDFAYYMAEACGFEESSTWPHNHIDWDSAARDLMQDYNGHDGHYFSSNW